MIISTGDVKTKKFVDQCDQKGNSGIYVLTKNDFHGDISHYIQTYVLEISRAM